MNNNAQTFQYATLSDDIIDDNESISTISDITVNTTPTHTTTNKINIPLHYLTYANCFSIIFILFSFYYSLLSIHSPQSLYNPFITSIFTFIVTPLLLLSFFANFFVNPSTSEDIKTIISNKNFIFGNLILSINILTYRYYILYNSKFSFLISLLVIKFIFYFYCSVYLNIHSTSKRIVNALNLFEYAALVSVISGLIGFSVDVFVNMVKGCYGMSWVFSFVLLIVSILILTYYNDYVICFCLLGFQVGLCVKESKWKMEGVCFAVFNSVCIFSMMLSEFIRKISLEKEKDISTIKRILFSKYDSYNTL